jgi:YkoY family integral membrane protein
MNDLIQQIFDNPTSSFVIIGNLIVIEVFLSVDNAAVLATMVMDLKEEQRSKALRYGIWGAYIFRGLAMLFAAFLIQIWWLKPLGGLYLLYLVWDWWKGKQTESKEDDVLNKEGNWLYKSTVGLIGSFWSTVVLIEFMDMAFSIDNVFAAVAFTPNIILICIGVFIGILAMRFVAQLFVKLMEKYPFLETSAFVVIGVLGIKLSLSIIEHFYPSSGFTKLMTSEYTEIYFSLITISIFFIPLLYNMFFVKKKTHI